ncbi:hypothetical protein J4531_11390 [Neisseria subflava]|nr:hypothetical protein [Neisseria subflava]
MVALEPEMEMVEVEAAHYLTEQLSIAVLINRLPILIEQTQLNQMPRHRRFDLLINIAVSHTDRQMSKNC